MSRDEKKELAALFQELITDQNKQIQDLQTEIKAVRKDMEWVGHLTWFGKVVLILLGVMGSIIGIIKGLRGIL